MYFCHIWSQNLESQAKKKLPRTAAYCAQFLNREHIFGLIFVAERSMCNCLEQLFGLTMFNDPAPDVRKIPKIPTTAVFLSKLAKVI